MENLLLLHGPLGAADTGARTRSRPGQYGERGGDVLSLPAATKVRLRCFRLRATPSRLFLWIS